MRWSRSPRCLTGLVPASSSTSRDRSHAGEELFSSSEQITMVSQKKHSKSFFPPQERAVQNSWRGSRGAAGGKCSKEGKFDPHQSLLSGCFMVSLQRCWRPELGGKMWDSRILLHQCLSKDGTTLLKLHGSKTKTTRTASSISPNNRCP